MIFIGFILVTFAVAGGYLMEQGNLHILFQPAEAVIIFGAAIGGFIIATPSHIIKLVKDGLGQAFKGRMYTKNDYIELLSLLYETLQKIGKEGLREIEKDVNNPEKCALFKKYPLVFNNPLAMTFLVDILRSIISTTLSAHELESLLDNELETVYEDVMASSKSVANVADALPGLGIVAAVLGVVITMQKMSEPPEVLGHSIGAAMVGTFLGVLMCYGFVGPLAKKLEYIAEEHRNFLDVIRVVFVSFTGGAHYMIATEFGRRVIPPNLRPTFDETERILGRKEKKEKKGK